MYLGVPLFYGRAKIAYFFYIVEKIQARIAGWHGKLLSFGGRIVLLKHVLASIPIHLLAAASPPLAILDRLEKMQIFYGDLIMASLSITGFRGMISQGL